MNHLLQFGESFIRIEGNLLTSNLKDPRPETPTAYDVAIDGLEALILAHAVAGVAVSSDIYKGGVLTALDKIINMYGDD